MSLQISYQKSEILVRKPDKHLKTNDLTTEKKNLLEGGLNITSYCIHVGSSVAELIDPERVLNKWLRV